VSALGQSAAPNVVETTRQETFCVGGRTLVDSWRTKVVLLNDSETGWEL
jgi:hypothetical protein